MLRLRKFAPVAMRSFLPFCALLTAMALPRSAQADLIQVPGVSQPEESATRPVGTLFQGRAYIAYAGTDGDHKVNVLNSDDLVTYRKQVLEESVESSGGVALAVHGDRLYLLFTALDEHLVLLSSPDGETWPTADIRVLPDLSEHQPSLAVHEGQLVVSYRNLSGGLNVLSTSTPLDTTSYVRRAGVGGSTAHGTSVASFEGRLLNAYTGHDDALNLQDLLGFGAALRANYVSDDSSDDGWWVTPWNGSLYATWRGSGNTNLNVGRFSPSELDAAFAGGGPIPNKDTAERSNLGPSLAAFGRTLALLWQGTDERVNIIRYETVSPRICAAWPVAYVDSGYGESGMSGVGSQLALARFAQYAVREGTRIVQQGFLDSEGCVTVTDVPIVTSTWTMDLTTVLRRGEGTVNVRMLGAAYKGPGVSDEVKLPHGENLSHSENLSLTIPLRIAPLDAEILAIPTLSGLVQEDATRIAAVAGQLLTTSIPLRGTAFAIDDGCQAYYPDSCAQGDTLLIGPKPNHEHAVPQSQEKFVVAHELGHVFEFLGGANAGHEGYPDLGVTELLCECSHVTVANQFHCLQSLEKAGDGRVEGFAQFIASRTFNRVTDPNPTFIYYKDFLWPQCPAGTRCVPFGEYFRQLPPIPVSANRAALWRNRNCPGVPEFATEFDWMNFFWNVSLPGPLEVTIAQLYQISAAAAEPGFVASNDLYLAAAREVVSAQAAERFVVFGREYGVSSDASAQ